MLNFDRDISHLEIHVERILHPAHVIYTSQNSEYPFIIFHSDFPFRSEYILCITLKWI